ncbi:MAG: LysR family transcriptional regulator [Roseibium sp.]|uniref:LysR family transcriptional regulator n=1 Tax=Roseibium sp. TaxID=1936156 RepID=UPI002610AAF1|nr:LysR family transcriptional regulator [Roseibium sp.]MCV0426209.1 LysR family transcriptional regulator [Roseibium sp.]
MKTYRKNLPPLDCLVFFEAAARNLSFTLASGELFVSQAAVSKRIRQLESFLGAELFVRNGRMLELTQSGQELFGKTSMTLDFIENALTRLSDQSDDAISIASSNAISMFWLQKQLNKFGLTEHSCPVNLMTSDKNRDLLKSANDLIVAPCDGNIPGYECTKLFSEQLVPVTAPDAAGKTEFNAREDLFQASARIDLPLLDFRRVEPFWMNWNAWARMTKTSIPDTWPRVHCKTYAHTIGKALEGEGIALGSLQLLADEISTGSLIPIGSRALDSKNDYYLIRDPSKPMADNAKHLYGFLLEATKLTRSTAP